MRVIIEDVLMTAITHTDTTKSPALPASRPRSPCQTEGLASSPGISPCLPARQWLQHRGYNTVVTRHHHRTSSKTETVGVESTDLVLGLLVPTEPVHDGDRQPARGDLLVALHVELVVDVLDGVVLVLPGLDTGAQVTPSHYHRLQEQSSAVQG